MEEHPGSWLNFFVDMLPERAHAFIDLGVITSWLIMVLLVLFAWLGTRKRLLRPRGLQTVWEIYYGFVRGFLVHEMGPSAERYVPLLGTLLIYILVMNLFGLIPGFITPTMSLNMTVPLAITVFLSVQYYGIREQRWRYLMHFIGEPMGNTWLMIGIYVILAPIMLVVHVIGEIARPLSLSVRLFGNMFGEETAIARMAALGAMVLAAVYVPLPVQIINVLLHLVIAPIQAYIFFLLSAAYIQMATAHEGADSHRPAQGRTLAA